MPRVIKINMRLRDAACDQHPRTGPVKVAEKLHRPARARLAGVRLSPAWLMTRHDDIVRQSERAAAATPAFQSGCRKLTSFATCDVTPEDVAWVLGALIADQSSGPCSGEAPAA